MTPPASIPMPPPAGKQSVPERLHGLDALRAFAMFLGIMLHAEVAYQVHQWTPWIFV